MAAGPIKRAFTPPVPNGVGGFNPYSAGRKHYGGGRLAPNVGKTANKAGYAARDGRAAARREALLRRNPGGI